MELLWGNSAWWLCSSEWDTILAVRNKLSDSKAVYKSIMGYAKGEKDASLGRTTGKLGERRKEELREYGFSPKNVVNCIRLCWSACKFFKSGHYVVSLVGRPIQQELMEIRTQPKNFSSAYVEQRMDKALAECQEAYASTSQKFIFDERLANWLCLELYSPLLPNLRDKPHFL